VENPADYVWSSAEARLKQKAKDQDKLLKVDPFIELLDDWRAFLAKTETEETLGVCRTIGIVTRKWGGRPNLFRI